MTAKSAKQTDLKRWATIHKIFAAQAEINLKKPTEEDFKRFARLSAWVSFFVNSRGYLPRMNDFKRIQYALGA